MEILKCNCGGEIKPMMDFFKQDDPEGKRREKMQKNFKKIFGKDLPDFKGFNCIECGQAYNEQLQKEPWKLGWLDGKKHKRQKAYIAPDMLLAMIINKDNVDLFNQKKAQLVTSPYAFWEALSCLSIKEIKEYAADIYKVIGKIPVIQPMTDQIKIQNKKRIKHLRDKAKKKITKFSQD